MTEGRRHKGGSKRGLRYLEEVEGIRYRHSEAESVDELTDAELEWVVAICNLRGRFPEPLASRIRSVKKWSGKLLGFGR